MFIDGWLIMRALGWQAVGVGMAAKKGYDRHKANQSYRREQDHYATVDSWWQRYGVPESECDRFLSSYTRSKGGIDSPELKDKVLGQLRKKVVTDDRYTNYLIKEGGTDLAGRMRVVILYYASMGKAAKIGSWSMNKHFPMAGALDTKPGLKKVVLQLLRENGVQDVHWYCESESEQENRLSAL